MNLIAFTVLNLCLTLLKQRNQEFKNSIWDVDNHDSESGQRLAIQCTGVINDVLNPSKTSNNRSKLSSSNLRLQRHTVTKGNRTWLIYCDFIYSNIKNTCTNLRKIKKHKKRNKWSQNILTNMVRNQPGNTMIINNMGPTLPNIYGNFTMLTILCFKKINKILFSLNTYLIS